jgi:hypothetical protein
MLSAGQRGCIVFTSSPANIIPSPFSTLYGATKSAVTHFAASLACELGPQGIDVAAVHPSPVATRFYDGAHALPTLLAFKATAGGADGVAAAMLAGVGRSVVIDQGYFPLLFKLLLRLIAFDALADILVRVAPFVRDYQFLKAQTDREIAAAGKKAPTPAKKAPTPAKKAPTPAPAAVKAPTPAPAAAAAAAAKAATPRGRATSPAPAAAARHTLSIGPTTARRGRAHSTARA